MKTFTFYFKYLLLVVLHFVYKTTICQTVAKPDLFDQSAKGADILMSDQSNSVISPVRVDTHDNQVVYTNAAHYGNAISCAINVNCLPYKFSWCREIRSVVKIETIHDDGNGGTYSGWSTAVLVNNENLNFHPYFLTAAHNLSDPNIIWDEVIIYFNWQSPECDNEMGNDKMTLVGINKLDATPTGCPDIAIFETDDPIPLQYNPYFAGWKRVEKYNDLENTSGVVIHHPRGDIKKISLGTIHKDDYFPFGERDCFLFETLIGSNQELGSSGAPLFNTDHRVIAIQSNYSDGEPDCEDLGNLTQQLGKIDAAWPAIGSYLGNSLSALSGIDPIGACQDDVYLSKNMYPGHDWMEDKNDIIIQAANTITAAVNNESTIITSSPAGISPTNYSDYAFIAGTSITLLQGFKVERDNHFLAKIGECEGFSECGFNYPEPVPFIVDLNDEIRENESDENILIYPNPFKESITIHIQDMTGIKSLPIRIYSSTGSVIKSFTQEIHNGNTFEINLNYLNPGIYFIEVCGNTCSTQKINKQ